MASLNDLYEAGDLDALFPAVTRYAIQIATRRNHPDPQSVGQDVAIAVWRSLPRFERKASFSTWVTGIVKRKLIDDARSAARRIQIVDVEDFPESMVEEQTDVFPLDRFDDDDRVLLCTFARYMDFGLAADELGMSVSALRSRLERLKRAA